MDYYTPIKKNEIMPLPAIWMDLKIVILSQVSQFSSVQSLSRVRLCVTPQTAAHQAPPSLGFVQTSFRELGEVGLGTYT